MTWTKQEYQKALNELVRDVDPHADRPGRWSTFLRDAIIAPMGKPPPRPLARVITSGTMP